ncbi:MAG: hypothetical protein QOC68_3173 [Solirubrobacteraceae bacterium]|nr:hypothetical protein [Solirubrobacteraceae bacterium]
MAARDPAGQRGEAAHPPVERRRVLARHEAGGDDVISSSSSTSAPVCRSGSTIASSSRSTAPVSKEWRSESLPPADTIARSGRNASAGLDALGAASNQQFQLMHDPVVFDRAATAVRARLDSAALPR